jgi:hypothetical protein
MMLLEGWIVAVSLWWAQSRTRDNAVDDGWLMAVLLWWSQSLTREELMALVLQGLCDCCGHCPVSFSRVRWNLPNTV